MNKVKILVTLLAFILVSSLAGSVLAQQEVTPGVYPGNSAKYSFIVLWDTKGENKTVPTTFVEQNQTESTELLITQVQGSVVGLNITTRFKGGNVTTVSDYLSLLTGQGLYSWGFIIAPNLNAGETAYPFAGDTGNSFTINETITKSYLGADRQVNHYYSNMSDQNYVYAYSDFYFDKNTGLMLEWFTEKVPTSNSNETASARWTITSANLEPPQHPAIQYLTSNPLVVVAIVVAVVVVLLAVFALGRRNRHKRRR